MILHVPDCVLMFFDRVLAFDHLRHQIHIVASADVTREAPRVAYERAVKDIARIEKKLAAGWKPANWRKGTVTGQVKAEAAGAHSEAEVSGKRPARQGIHCCRRHFPGRAFRSAGISSRESLRSICTARCAR